MKKKLLAILLAAVMAVGLLPGTAFAAGGGYTQLQNAKISLKEEYLFAGRTSDWWQEEAYRASPVAIDLDKDGDLEILIAAHSLTVVDAKTHKTEWRINSGKDRSDGYTLAGNVAGQVFTDFEVLDIDADGRNEIVIGYQSGLLAVLDDQGYFKWTAQPCTSSIRSIAVGDLSGNGKMEIVVGYGRGEEEGGQISVWVYDCYGNIRPGWPQLDPSQDGHYFDYSDRPHLSTTAYSFGVFGDGIALGDLNGDGKPEIIVPTDTAYIDAYYFNGSLVKASDYYRDQYGTRMWGKIALWEDPAEEKRMANEGWGIPGELDSRAHTYKAELGHAGTLYTDVDGDGVSEIVVTALMVDRTTYDSIGNDHTTIDDSRYMTVYILNQDRTRYVNKELGFDWSVAPNDLTHPGRIGGPLKSYEEGMSSMAGDVYSEPVAADLDGDGYQEILFNSYDGKLHCFTLDQKGWSFTLPKTTDKVYEYATPPVCKDLDGDGTMEVIFASWTDCDVKNRRDGIYGNAINGGGTGVNGALYVLSCNGELLAKQDLHYGYCKYEDQKDPTAGFTNGVMGSPVVQDIDGDGKYEVLLNTTYYGLCVYEINVDQPGSAAFCGFTDVDPKDPDTYYANAVQWAVTNGIALGTDPGKFSPDKTCTHIQILTFLWRADGRPTAPSSPVPKDPGDHVDYHHAIDWAYSKGMIGTDFKQDADCTRADTVKYIWQAFGSKSAADQGFTDVSANSAHFTAVNWAAANGVTAGVGDNKFEPDTTCTRGQIVTFLHRAYVQAYTPA